MKEIFKALGKEALGFLKELNWKSIVLKGWQEILLPKLQAWAKADEKVNWNDQIVAGLDLLIQNFLDESKEDSKKLAENRAISA